MDSKFITTFFKIYSISCLSTRRKLIIKLNEKKYKNLTKKLPNKLKTLNTKFEFRMLSAHLFFWSLFYGFIHTGLHDV